MFDLYKYNLNKQYSIDLSDLIVKQYQLDKTIQQNHNVSYKDTITQRVMALIVELGEFANTTRCFKFWSNKGKDSKDRVLDEAADCLHFYLSIQICIVDTDYKYLDNYLLDKAKELELSMYESFDATKEDLTELFLRMFKGIPDVTHGEISNLEKMKLDYGFGSFYHFLLILSGLGYTFTDLKNAYLKKLKVNYDRQDNNY